MTTFPGAARPSPRGWPDGITPGFVEVGADPSTGAGFAAPIGSIAKFGTLYYEKVGTTATSWVVIPASGATWADAVEAWALPIVGFTAGRFTRIHETFQAPGKVGATTDFGERWDLVVGAGAAAGHQTAGAATWRGGVAVIEQNSGAWTDNYLLWKGPGLIFDGAAERSAVIYRLFQHVRPAANVNNQVYVGLLDAFPATKFVAFEQNEAVNGTFCIVQVSGSSDVVTTFPIASLSTAGGRDVAFLQVGTNWKVYVDRTLYATVATNGSVSNLKPFIYANKGTLVVDDVLILCDGAFA